MLEECTSGPAWPLPWRTLAVAAAFCTCACGDPSNTSQPTANEREVSPAPRSVCEDCPEQLGGESSDFGGTPHACVSFEERVPIDRARASELGFDVAMLEQRISRAIAAPLRWTARTTGGGGPAAGYAAQTWIEGHVTIQSYTYKRLDPAACSGTRCLTDVLEEWTCSDSLELGVSAMLETRDGAVSAHARGYVLHGRSGFPFGDRPAGSVIANLRGVIGTLEVAPDPGLEIVYAGLFADLMFDDAATIGFVRPDLLLRERNSVRHVQYNPLLGRWPDPE
jgi:hypothetical protein